PQLTIGPQQYVIPYKIQITGTGWGSCPVRLSVGGEKAMHLDHALVGEARRDAIVPVRGIFSALFSVPGLEPGGYTVVARDEDRDDPREANADFAIVDDPRFEKDGRPTNRWLRRQEHFFKRRFSDGILPNIPPRLIALEHRDAMRRREQLKLNRA